MNICIHTPAWNLRAAVVYNTSGASTQTIAVIEPSTFWAAMTGTRLARCINDHIWRTGVYLNHYHHWVAITMVCLLVLRRANAANCVGSESTAWGALQGWLPPPAGLPPMARTLHSWVENKHKARWQHGAELNGNKCTLIAGCASPVERECNTLLLLFHLFTLIHIIMCIYFIFSGEQAK